MSTGSITIGSGLGGSAIAAPQATYGGMPSFTSARTLIFKTAKMTHRQHPIQGGAYLAGGRIFDIGSAREILWLDAMVTLDGDVCNTAQALLLASALGGTSTLTQIGTTTAYGLNGVGPALAGAPDTNLTLVDMQINSPTADNATQQCFTYHSGIITKAEWVFDKNALVSYSYDIDFQYVEQATAQTAAVQTTSAVPFNMAGSVPVFEVGTLGAEASIVGVKKCTITLARKMDLERIYVGNQYKNLPVSNGIVDITVAMDTEYTSSDKATIYDLQLSGVPTSVIVKCVGGAIGSSGYNNTFGFNVTNAFLDTGGEAPLDGPEIVKNTATFRGTIDAAGDAAFRAYLQTADSSY